MPSPKEIMDLPPSGTFDLDMWLEVQREAGGVGSSLRVRKSTLVAAIAEALYPIQHSDLEGLLNDDHPQYLTNARGDARYVPVSFLEAVDPFPQYETGAEAQARVDAALAAHVALPDPHPQYETGAEAQAKVDAAIAAHVLASDPHSQYMTEAEVNAAIAAAGSSVSLSDNVPQDLGTADAGNGTQAARDDHVHKLPTKAELGLGNVDNTADVDKPVSTPIAAAIAAAIAGVTPSGDAVDIDYDNTTSGLAALNVQAAIDELAASGGGGSGGGSSDPYFANVVSLLHFDGANGSTAFTDVTGKVWTHNGGTALSTTSPKFGTANLLVGTTDNGTGITTPNDSDFDLGTGEFTIEWWEYITDGTGYQTAFNRGYIGSGGLLIQSNGTGTGYVVYVSGGAAFTESAPRILNAYTHYALVRLAGVLKLYRNGVETGSAATGINFTTSALASWGTSPTATYGLLGRIDEARITKGIARYTAAFTPPTLAFPDGGGTVDSVNGQTGTVVLGAADVGAATAAQGATADTALQPGDGLNALDSAANTKLAGIAAGAEVNVNADWNSVSGDSEILNKPTLGTAAATNSTDYATAAQGSLADSALQPNTPITGATKTKVTYDADGLVTNGADATTADIADSADKRYVTDAQLTVVGNTSGVNTGDLAAIDQATAEAGASTTLLAWTSLRVRQAINAALALGTWISGATSKTAPTGGDYIPISDSAASGATKKLSFTDFFAAITSALSTVYQATLVSGTNIKTINSTSLLGSGDIAISGGGSASPKTAFVATTECQGNAPTNSNFGDFVAFTAASGTVANSSTAFKTNSAGYWSMTLAVVAGSKSSFGSPINNPVLFGEGEAYFAARGELGVLSDASNTFLMEVGFIQSVSSSATASGAYFAYTHTASGGNWEAKTVRDNIVTTSNTGVAAVAGNDLKFEITANAAGTSIEFKINGSVVATHTTNIPTGIYRTGYGLYAKRPAGDAGNAIKIAFNCDYAHVRQTYTSAR